MIIKRSTFFTATTLAICILFSGTYIIYKTFFPSKHIQQPKLTVVFVIDQGAYYHFLRLAPFFQKGFKTLLENGICYDNAHHPHGGPVTATGHTTISTGCLAKDHGISGNSWLDEEGNAVDFGNDPARGYSWHQVLCNNLSDLLKANESSAENFAVFALSPKARSAVAMAGNLGKAIWFDDEQKRYVTNNTYFKETPSWLTAFNQHNNVAQLKSATWTPRYAETALAYKLPFIDDYEYAAAKEPLVGKTIQLYTTANPNQNNGGLEKEYTFNATPAANDLLFSLSKACIDTNFSTQKKDRFLLWISASNLDLMGHLYGPYSKEVVDMLYHLDWQVGDFLEYLDKKIGLENVLFVLTADHGVAPIPELMQKQGYYAARRIDSNKLLTEMNTLIEDKFKIPNFVHSFKNNQFFFDPKKVTALPADQHAEIATLLKEFLQQQPGIKHCWSKQDFKTKFIDPQSLEQFYKNQFYEPRSGDLVCMPYPYTLISKYPTGTGHMSAYAYDTQVPLILYQKGQLTHKQVTQRVWTTQLAPTIAKLYNVQKIPNSMAQVLPLTDYF